MGDSRDKTTWLAVELTSLGERSAEKGDLEVLLREAWGLDADHPLFIPCIRIGGAILNGMEGYVFVGSDLPPIRNTQTPYTKRVLTGSRGSFATIPNDKILEIRQSLQELLASEYKEGDAVSFRVGLYKGLSGKIVEISSGDACVLIQLRSLRVLTSASLFSLGPASE